ncbi:hypothetical protein PR048_008780, partial [Dryococelus australis]
MSERDLATKVCYGMWRRLIVYKGGDKILPHQSPRRPARVKAVFLCEWTRLQVLRGTIPMLNSLLVWAKAQVFEQVFTRVWGIVTEVTNGLSAAYWPKLNNGFSAS